MQNNQHKLNPREEYLSILDRQFSLLDMARFLKKSAKLIAIGAILGIILSIAYLQMAPKQYVATAQISMAKFLPIRTGPNYANNNIDSFGVNVEDPALLISRLTSPASITQKLVDACGLKNQPDIVSVLSRSIKLTIPIGVPNVIEIKTFGYSPQFAQDCALALFDLIGDTQADIIAPYIEGVKINLTEYEGRLKRLTKVVSQADKSNQAMWVSYLSTRDEIRYLLDEISSMKNVITFDESHRSRLVSPIYAPNAPIAPKKHLVFFAGLLGGLFIAVIIALIRRLFFAIKLQKQGAR